MRRPAIVAALSLGLFLASCSGGKPSASLGPAEIEAIDRIYEASAGTFRNATIDVQVHAGGAIRLELKGALQRKSGVPGDVWIPILFATKLPQYFRPTRDDDQIGVSIEAYLLKSGLWCIAAVVRQPEEAEPVADGQEETTADVAPPNGATPANIEPTLEPPRPLTVRLDLVSPAYQTALPFLIPSGPEQDAVTVSVALPGGSRFLSPDTAISIVSLPDRPEQNVSTPKLSLVQQSLTAIPAVLGAAPGTVAATVYSPDVLAYDFTGIEFSKPRKLPPWSTSVALLVVGWALVLYIWTTQRRRESWIKHHSIVLVDKNMASIARLVASLEPMEPEARWSERWYGVQKALSDDLRWADRNNRWRDLPALMATSSLAGFLGEVTRHPGTSADDKAENKKKKIAAETSALLSTLQQWNSNERPDRRNLFETLLIMPPWLLALLVCVAAGLLFSVAQAQTTVSKPKNEPPITTMLRDLHIEVQPRSLLEKDADKVDVKLRFVALSSDKKARKVNLVFGSGAYNSISIDSATASADKSFEITQQSRDQITISLKPTFCRALIRLGKIKDLVAASEGVDTCAKESSSKGNWVALSYALQGAQVVHTSWHPLGVRLHRFPFESADLIMPLEMGQAALLSHVRLTKPSNEYSSDVSFEGLPIVLKESESGGSYEFSTSGIGTQPLWVHDKLVVRADFSRPESLMFVWCALVLGISVGAGIFLGYMAAGKDKAPIVLILGEFGILGGLLALRVAVTTFYKDIPNIVLLQGVAIFDLLIAAGWVVAGLVGVAVYSAKR